MTIRFGLELLALAVPLAVSLPLPAQTTASAGLIVGYYRPFGHFDPASEYSTDLPGRPSDLRGPTWGGVGHLSIGRRFGVEAQVSVAQSAVPMVDTPDGPRGPTNASVDIVSLEAQYDVSPAPERHRLWLSAGPVLVRHAGDAYAPYGNPRSIGAAGGVGLTVPLRSRLQFAADLTTLWYTFNVPMPPALRLNPGPLEHGAQRDALLHVGLRWGRS
jgi:hypothetical protein